MAASDPEQRFALPLRSLNRRDGDPIKQIEALISEDETAAVVVGLPLSLSGEASAQTEAARDFARELESRLSLPIHLYDERLSTQEALRLVSDDDRRGRRKSRSAEADTDALAASIILQAYLDRQRVAEGGS